MAQGYRQSTTEVVQDLKTHATQGMSAAENEARLCHFGVNELIERGGRTNWRILWEQFTETMVPIMLAAAVTSAFLPKW